MGKAAPWGFGKMWLVRVWGAGQWEERDAGSWPLQAIYYRALFHTMISSTLRTISLVSSRETISK